MFGPCIAFLKRASALVRLAAGDVRRPLERRDRPIRKRPLQIGLTPGRTRRRVFLRCGCAVGRGRDTRRLGGRTQRDQHRDRSCEGDEFRIHSDSSYTGTLPRGATFPVDSIEPFATSKEIPAENTALDGRTAHDSTNRDSVDPLGRRSRITATRTGSGALVRGRYDPADATRFPRRPFPHDARRPSVRREELHAHVHGDRRVQPAAASGFRGARVDRFRSLRHLATTPGDARPTADEQLSMLRTSSAASCARRSSGKARSVRRDAGATGPAIARLAWPRRHHRDRQRGAAHRHPLARLAPLHLTF